MTYSILYFTEGQRDVMTLPKTRLQGRPESRHTVDPNPSQQCTGPNHWREYLLRAERNCLAKTWNPYKLHIRKWETAPKIDLQELGLSSMMWHSVKRNEIQNYEESLFLAINVHEKCVRLGFSWQRLMQEVRNIRVSVHVFTEEEETQGKQITSVKANRIEIREAKEPGEIR